MTRILLYMVCILSGTSLWAQQNQQSAPTEAEVLTYHYADSATSITKNELFKKAHKWLDRTYNPANKAWLKNDTSRGVMQLNACKLLEEKSPIATINYLITFTVSITITDNRITLDISDLKLDKYLKLDRYSTTETLIGKTMSATNVPRNISKEGWAKAMKDWELQMNDLNASFVKYITQK